MDRHKVYSIEFTRTAKKQFQDLGKKVQSEIATLLEDDLAVNPLKGKPLKSVLKGLRSLRLGLLRIIYKVDKGILTITIIRIEHRKQVYRKVRKR